MNNYPISFYLIQTAALFAGLSLFLTGMSAMSKGLQDAAGKGIRRILQRATADRRRAISLGTMLGGLIHSSAASVMLIGFISAGLVTFSSSVPVILGINIGTTLSMLMISFRLGDACWLAILAGFLLRLRPQSRHAGTALLGFGLIFLGLNVMSDAIYPFRDELAPILRYSNGKTLQGMLTGVIASLLFTAIIQSSGATIGMVFAMLTAGAMTSFEQAYPVIIGANVGTCATALIGAARSTIEAKRCALTHLLFNIFATSLAMITAPIMYRFIPLTTPAITSSGISTHILVSQCANANVIKMILAATIALPFSSLAAATVRTWMPDRKKNDTTTLLDPDLATTPEDALQAAILELHRMTQLCTQRLQHMPQLLLHQHTTISRKLQETETAVATIRESMQHFLRQLSHMALTRRQSMLATLLYNGIDHVERIADHIGVLARALYERHRNAQTAIPLATLRELLQLNKRTTEVMQALESVLVPRREDRAPAITKTLQARDRFMQAMEIERNRIATDLAQGTCTPATAIFRTCYFTELSRIVKHARALALQTDNRHFRIKTKRLGKSV
ncbi:MAG: Na/Pi cotransporter family protein [Kiritimatiellia bacterium]